MIGGHRPPTSPPGLAFSPEGDALLTQTPGDPRVRVLSVPDGREIRHLDFEFPRNSRITRRDWAAIPQGVLFGVPQTTNPNLIHLELWPYEGGPPHTVGSFQMAHWSVDHTGSSLALHRNERVSIRPLGGPAAITEKKIATVAMENEPWFVFSPNGDHLAVAEITGRLTMWPLNPDVMREPRILQQEEPERQFTPEFDADGSRLVWASGRAVSLWRLEGPPSADPVVLIRGVEITKKSTFHPSGNWLAVANHQSITFWAIRQPQPFVLRGHGSMVRQVSFTDDSKWLISCGRQHGVRTWPLNPGIGDTRDLGLAGVSNCNGLAVAPDGEQIILGGYGGARLISLSDSKARVLTLRPPDGGIYGAAFDSSGRRAATATFFSPGPPKKIRIWDIDSDALIRELPLAPPGESEDSWDWGVWQLAFTPGGKLFAAGERGIRRFDTETGRSEWIWQLERGWEASIGLSRDGRRLLATAFPRESTGAESYPVVLFDLVKGTRQTITSHGNRVVAVALDPSGTIMVTGDQQGAVRVGPADNGEPHLLLGHSDSVNRWGNALAVSPDGQWIASGADTEIRLWPVPDLTKPPLHTLPLDQLLAKLHELTNLQVIEDEASPTGYRLEIGPFPGWETAPEW